MTVLGMHSERFAQLPLATKNALARLENWDLSHVRSRVQEQFGWSDDFVFRAELGYRRFLSLVVLKPKKRYGMAGPADEVWHGHLLITPDYLEMCRSVAGTFIHHVPMTSEQESQGERSYSKTLSELTAYYGVLDEAVWPEASGKCGRCAGCSGVSED